jgi:hypothetical protein
MIETLQADETGSDEKGSLLMQYDEDCIMIDRVMRGYPQQRRRLETCLIVVCCLRGEEALLLREDFFSFAEVFIVL